MLVLYQGLKPKTFYWEFVNTIRKVLILMCSVFLSTENAMYKILASIIILLAIIRVQLKLKPYKLEENNELEQKAIYAGIITLFCGLIFSQETSSVDLFINLAFVCLIYSNAVFIIYWTFYLFLSLNIKNKNFKKFMNCYAIIIMRRSAIDKFESFNEKSSTSLTQAAESSKRKRKHKLVEKQMKKKEKSVKTKHKLNVFKKKSKKNEHPRVTFKTENQTNMIFADDVSDNRVKEEKDSFKSENKLKETFKIKSLQTKSDKATKHNTNKFEVSSENIKTNERYKHHDNLSESKNLHHALSNLSDSSLVFIQNVKKSKNSKKKDLWELSEY